MTVETLFGEVETPGQLRSHTAGAAGVAGAISNLAPLGGGIGAIPAMLLYGASDLFGRVIPEIFKSGVESKAGWEGKGRLNLEGPTEMQDWFGVTPAQLDALRAQNPEFGTIIRPGPDGVYEIDIYTGEYKRIGPLPEGYATSPPVTPPPSPPPSTEPPISPGDSGVPTDTGGPMGMISTGLGMLGGLAGDLVSGVTGLVDDFLPLAQQTAPLWGMAAPKAATILTGGVPAPAPQAGATTVSYPTAMPGGASVVPAVGVPFVDLAPPGSTPITPYQTQSSTRLPSTVTVPYQTSTGTKYAFYRNMGRPLLYSGDLAAVKRAKKVASRARRRVGGR